MDYNLAKELKEKGFPQKYDRYHNVYLAGDFSDDYNDEIGFGEIQYSGKPHKELIIIPTLEELIEACGDRFAYLAKQSDGKWRARCDNGDAGVVPPIDGLIPSEAVARLWLELNK